MSRLMTARGSSISVLSGVTSLSIWPKRVMMMPLGTQPFKAETVQTKECLEVVNS